MFPLSIKEVSVYQYDEGILNIGKGYINKIHKESIQYSRSSAENTEEYKGGCPLLFKVVGIDVGPDELKGRGNRKAVDIRFILQGFKTYVSKKLNGGTENDLWLEKINQIPQNEYEYVGSGGYGQVFKIKIQTELVLKIIRPVGKVCDYKEEASALEREYRLVTSLENHPRIIQLLVLSQM